MNDITFQKQPESNNDNQPQSGIAYVLEEYGDQFTLAVILITIMYNLFLIMQIKYGDKLITKLTLWPYYFSLLALIFFAGMEIVEEYISESLLFSNENFIPGKVTGRRFWLSMYCFRQVSWLCFIGLRVFEDTVLLMFIEFQSGLRLDQLEVARPLYLEQEVYLTRLAKIILSLFATLQIAALIAGQFNATN